MQVLGTPPAGASLFLQFLMSRAGSQDIFSCHWPPQCTKCPKMVLRALHFLSYGRSHWECACIVCVLGNSSVTWIITGFGALLFSAMALYAGRSLQKYLYYVFFPPLKPPRSIDEVRLSSCHPLGNGGQMFGFCR